MLNEVIFRHALKSDCAQLLRLMKQLAIFEDYIDDFEVTVNDLIIHGFPSIKNQTSSYTAVIAEQDGQLLGYLVYYLIPFTYDLKPTLFIKELYVDKDARGKNIGKGLMSLTTKDAKNKNCGRLKWDVLSDNIKAQQFYQKLGATYDNKWQGYLLEI